MARQVAPEGTAHRVQVELLRAAGPSRRAALCRSLSASVISLARQAIRARHPGYSEREVDLAFVGLHYGEELATDLRRHLRSRAG